LPGPPQVVWVLVVVWSVSREGTIKKKSPMNAKGKEEEPLLRIPYILTFIM
jgi:hypothetical protein